jgi:hypothetical protein
MDQLLKDLTKWINTYADVYDNPLAMLPTDLVQPSASLEISEPEKPVLKKIKELKEDEILSPEFEVKGFVGESVANSVEFTINNEKLSKFGSQVENAVQDEISEYRNKLDTAWDKIVESLNSAEDWENLTPEEWESMLKPPALFQSIPTLTTPVEQFVEEKEV